MMMDVIVVLKGCMFVFIVVVADTYYTIVGVYVVVDIIN